MLKHDRIWKALPPQMPPLAFVRNLPALTAHGVIRPMAAGWAVERISRLRARTTRDGRQLPVPVHPFNILLAMMVYRMGRSIDGASKWNPVPQVSAISPLPALFPVPAGNRHFGPAGKRATVGRLSPLLPRHHRTARLSPERPGADPEQ